MYFSGTSGLPAGAGAASHGRPAVAELAALHRLPLAAVRDGVEAEVAPDRIDLGEIVAAVRHDAAVAIQAAEAAVDDLVDLARGDAEVLAALRDGWRLVPDEVVAVVDLADDVRGVAVAPREDGGGHAHEGNEGRLGRLPVPVGLASEDGRGLPAVHEAAEDATIDVRHAPSRCPLVVVGVVTV